MTHAVSLAELRTRSLAAADMRTLGQTQYVQPDEVNYLINDEHSELYDLLVAAFEDYVTSTQSVALVAGQTVYTLPSDFYKPRGLYGTSAAANDTDIPSFEEGERARLAGRSAAGVGQLHYRVEGSSLTILPPPAGGASLTLRYIPQCAYLTNDADTISYPFASGWDAYIVYGVGAVLKGKADKDPSVLMAKKEALRQRIITMRGQRTTTGPKRVKDVYGWCPMRRG
jgi:hypothetical protein